MGAEQKVRHFRFIAEHWRVAGTMPIELSVIVIVIVIFDVTLLAHGYLLTSIYIMQWSTLIVWV